MEALNIPKVNLTETIALKEEKIEEQRKLKNLAKIAYQLQRLR